MYFILKDMLQERLSSCEPGYRNQIGIEISTYNCMLSKISLRGGTQTLASVGLALGRHGEELSL